MSMPKMLVIISWKILLTEQRQTWGVQGVQMPRACDGGGQQWDTCPPACLLSPATELVCKVGLLWHKQLPRVTQHSFKGPPFSSEKEQTLWSSPGCSEKWPQDHLLAKPGVHPRAAPWSLQEGAANPLIGAAKRSLKGYPSFPGGVTWEASGGVVPAGRSTHGGAPSPDWPRSLNNWRSSWILSSRGIAAPAVMSGHHRKLWCHIQHLQVRFIFHPFPNNS